MIKKQTEKIFKFIEKKKNGCWIWKGGTYDAGTPRLYVGGLRHPIRKWLFNLKSDKHVHASCNNQKCVNPAHATHSCRPGELNANCKLTAKKVIKIRKEYASGKTAKQLAKEHKVHYSYIYKVVDRTYWKNV